MNLRKVHVLFLMLTLLSTSCVVSKKKYTALQTDLETSQKEKEVLQGKIYTCEKTNASLTNENTNLTSSVITKEGYIDDLKEQLKDCKEIRDKQLTAVGDLTILTQAANDNIKESLAQLERKDKYIHLLQEAKSKADSLNLALAVNLKGVLKDGFDDKDVDIKVDKTVVFINLSDNVLFKKGSADLSPKANEVLAKIALIIESRPDLEVMIEGYTDSDPIKNACNKDNWDLSVRRSTSVVRMLQGEFKINPNRLIAAGRGEFNALAPNDTDANKAINRRTRIIIMPKLNQFYDLLDPKNAPQ
jgi:chemotaxis protein MotB